MDTESKVIASRVRELREILDLSVEDVAAKLQLSKEEYLCFENNEMAFPISTLTALAGILNVDYTELLT